MSEYARYPEYKDSGVPWLGEIPSHWQSKRLKFLGEIVLGLTYSPEDITTDTENSTLILRSSNVQNGKLAFDDNVFVTKNIPKKMITTENDILICSRNGSRALIGKCALIEGQALNQAFGAFMTVYRSPYRKFIYYMLNSEIFKSQLGTFLTSTINQLTTQVLGNFEIGLPPEKEQKAINDFLDRELGKIDALIDKQQLLLDKLAEQRSAVITQAVTKGLNPNAEMKDSGVAWLGGVPSHWIIANLKYFISCASGDALASSNIKKEPDSDNEIPVIGGNGLFGFTSDSNFNHECLSIGRVGALCGNVHYINYPSWINDNALVIKLRTDKINLNFLEHLLRQRNLNELASKTAQPLLTGTQVKHEKIVIPPINEQLCIVDFIEDENSKIDQMTETVNRTIERLKEYRSTLITQAVTGKIKVF
ncbi:restriction endonuclease subunit S [Faucicola atlantae]|uniref:Type I restriction modification DNA specificity domain-containing protein n=1 Tax=Faucicola atlantae TaxID=34059 RepID=A0A1B8Q9X9_9GAMM|nr:restriction endonuclease subunit S [Moraxella atlantae]OBX75921.1 hypothetical protein A9306_01435 [Moraxella atlantae]